MQQSPSFRVIEPCSWLKEGSFVSYEYLIKPLCCLRCFVVFRDQDINIHEQLDLARHFGPLHKHATTPIPRNGLEEVHGKHIQDDHLGFLI